jgi:hypothetical protein
MTRSLRFRAAIVSVVLFVAFIGIWHLATRGTGAVATMTPEYARLMGLTATQGKSAMPGPLDVAAKLWEHLKRPFYDNGPNDKGLGIQLGYSIARAGIGYTCGDGCDPRGFPTACRPICRAPIRSSDPETDPLLAGCRGRFTFKKDPGYRRFFI